MSKYGGGCSRFAFLWVLVAVPWSLACAGEAPTPAAGAWANVTANVGGETWGYAGVCLLAAVPDSADVIAGVSESGLWLTSDGGTSWKKLGANDKEQIKHRPHKIVFDPQSPAVFWVSGCYGPTPFKTSDGGATFQKLGALNHSDGVAVDLTDPERKTLLLGLHEQARSLQLSKDGGKTWTKIGERLPENSNHSTDPIIIDTKTFLINTAGWKQNATLGIYRSEDAGETWSQVSKFGPGGTPLISSDGQIYWQRIWGGGLLRSTDKGKTWRQLPSPVKGNVIELPDKRLAGTAEKQVFISADAGAQWTKLGPPVPFKASGIAYSSKGKCFYAWRLTDKKDPLAIVRLENF